MDSVIIHKPKNFSFSLFFKMMKLILLVMLAVLAYGKTSETNPRDLCYNMHVTNVRRKDGKDIVCGGTFADACDGEVDPNVLIIFCRLHSNVQKGRRQL